MLGIIVFAAQEAVRDLAPQHSVEDRIVGVISNSITVTSLSCLLLFTGTVQEKLAVSSSKFKGLVVGDGRTTAAIIQSILVNRALFVTGWHFMN